MGKIKLAALDMDGTLLNDEKQISPGNKNSITAALNRGIYLTLITGRTFQSARPYAEQLGINLPLITYNGALIKCARTEERLYSAKIPAAAVREVIEFGESYDIYTKVYIDDILFVEKDNQEAREFSRVYGIEYRVAGKLSESIKSKVNMIVFKGSADLLNFSRGKINEIKTPISFTQSNPVSLEIMAPGVTKQKALSLLADKYGIKRGEILTVGNSINDLEMLRWAGTGIAMKNSYPRLLAEWKVKSKYDNNHDGVARILEKYL